MRMHHFSNAELVEMAYAIANGEELDAEQAQALQFAQGCDQSQDGGQSAERGHLRTEVEAYGRVFELVRAALASAPQPDPERVGACLDDETVAAYLDHALAPRDRAAAEVHFGRCRACLGQLAELAELVTEAPATYESTSVLTYVLEVAREGLRFLSHPEGGFSLLDPKPVAVLGVGVEAQACCTWRQYFGVYNVLISVVQASDDHVDVSLTVSRDTEPVPKTRITLRRDDHIVQSESTAASGRVCLPNLETGAYECEIRLPEGDLKRHFKLDLRGGATS